MKKPKRAKPEVPADAPPIPVHCAHDAMEDAATLKPHPQNPKRHPDAQVAMLGRVIRAQGWRAPIVVSRRSGCIVAGHGRWQAAVREGWARVPVNFQDFASEADELAHLLADNRLAELGEMDKGLLEAAVAQLEATGGDIDLTGFTAADLDVGEPPSAEPVTVEQSFRIVITCKDESEQASLLGELGTRGITCKAAFS